MKSLFITATDTDVGKSVVASGLMTALSSKKINACYYKPVESGGVQTQTGLQSGECTFIRAYNENAPIFNTYCFERPMSPHLASRLEGIQIDPLHIKEDYENLLQEFEFVLVEGAGGLAVPLVESEYMLYDLIQDLAIEVLIVADAGLGAINHTTLTVALARQLGIAIRGIVLNRYDGGEIHAENAKSIEAITQVPVLAAIPELDFTDKDLVKRYFEETFPFSKVIGIE